MNPAVGMNFDVAVRVDLGDHARYADRQKTVVGQLCPLHRLFGDHDHDPFTFFGGLAGQRPITVCLKIGHGIGCQQHLMYGYYCHKIAPFCVLL